MAYYAGCKFNSKSRLQVISFYNFQLSHLGHEDSYQVFCVSINVENKVYSLVAS